MSQPSPAPQASGRRDVLAAFTSSAALAASDPALGAGTTSRRARVEDGDLVPLQGDSTTDAGRGREPASQAAGAPPARKPRCGDLLEVEVAGYAAGGGLWGRHVDATGEYRVELRRGVPGERARVLVLARHGHDLRCRVEAVLGASPAAATPRCGHFPDCGGCSHQDLAYATQLEQKRAVARRVLAGAGLPGQPDVPEVEAVLPCEPPWRYRNKMDFTFGSARWVQAGEAEGVERDFALGLHPAGQYEKVLDVESCAITFAEADAILADARGLAREQGLEAWDIRRRAGLLRHLVLRKSFARGAILANLVTSEEAPQRVLPYVEALLARQPGITTLVQTIHAGRAKTALGERELTLHGPGWIVEELAGFEFRISARSFFQTNTPQAGRLVRLVVAAAAAGPGQTLFDLYCGAGSLTLALAARGPRTVGFELVAEAVEDARENARRNGVEGLELVAGDVAETILADGLPRPDVVVVDPPRAGLHPRVAEALASCAARRLVYVSCNLASAARDAVKLRYGGWHLARVQPIDLFPHTPHLESVLTLERGG